MLLSSQDIQIDTKEDAVLSHRNEACFVSLSRTPRLQQGIMQGIIQREVTLLQTDKGKIRQRDLDRAGIG